MKRYIKTSIDNTKLNPYLQKLEDFIKPLGFRGSWGTRFTYRNAPMTITLIYAPAGKQPAKIIVRCDDTSSQTSSTYFIPDDFGFLFDNISNFKKVADDSGRVQDLMNYENENVPLYKVNKGATYTGKSDDLKWNGL